MTGAAELLAKLAAARERAAQRPVRYGRDSGHCGRRACRCTHTAPCDHGWIDAPAYVNPETGEVYENVAPCPVCRPDAADRMVDRLRRESEDAP